MRVFSNLPDQAIPRRFGRGRTGRGGWTRAATRCARVVAIATGDDAVPTMPEWATERAFAGELLHSSSLTTLAKYHDCQVLVVGRLTPASTSRGYWTGMARTSPSP